MTSPATPAWLDALARLDDASATSRPDRSGLTRPTALEYLGKAVAQRLAPDDVDLILTWDRTDDATLGHVVARELGIDVALVFEPAEGQLSFDRDPTPGQKVAFIGISFGWQNSIRAPVAFVAGRGARVVRVVALAESPVMPSELGDPSVFLTVSAP